MLFKAGNQSRIYLYEGEPSVPEHTVAYFYVEDIYTTIEQLRDKGLSFEEYDFGDGYKTDENGVAEKDGIKYAWFKDPEGHFFALAQIN